jgi:Bacterial Ig domain
MKWWCCLALVPAFAAAEDHRIVKGAPNADDQVFARQVIEATGASSTVAQSKVIYLNKSGVTLDPGDNDARTNKSTLAKQRTQIPPWNTSDATWQATVSCMKELFAPFDVTIVTTDPGPTVQHIEAVFGGRPQVLSMDTKVMGVAPFKSDCTILENAMVFTFTDNFPNDARTACEVQAQEVAHAFGLDHERLPTDPLTYMRYDGNRSFQNQLAECGETKARMCGVAGSTSCRGKQNSVALLFDRLGAKGVLGDDTAPNVTITAPANGAKVPQGFTVSINATDNTRVTMASIYIDGVPSGSSSVAPWGVKAPSTMVRGKHKVKVEVTDGRNTRSSEIEVTVEGDAETPSEDLDGGCSTSSGAGLLLGLLALTTTRAGSRRCARSRSRRGAAACDAGAGSRCRPRAR